MGRRVGDLCIDKTDPKRIAAQSRTRQTIVSFNIITKLEEWEKSETKTFLFHEND